MVNNILVRVDLFGSLIINTPYFTIPGHTDKYDQLAIVFMENIGDGYFVHRKDPNAVIDFLQCNNHTTIEQLAALPTHTHLTVPSCKYEIRENPLDKPPKGTYCDVTLAIIDSHKVYLNYILNS